MRTVPLHVVIRNGARPLEGDCQGLQCGRASGHGCCTLPNACTLHGGGESSVHGTWSRTSKPIRIKMMRQSSCRCRTWPLVRMGLVRSATTSTSCPRSWQTFPWHAKKPLLNCFEGFWLAGMGPALDDPVWATERGHLRP